MSDEESQSPSLNDDDDDDIEAGSDILQDEKEKVLEKLSAQASKAETEPDTSDLDKEKLEQMRKVVYCGKPPVLKDIKSKRALPQPKSSNSIPQAKKEADNRAALIRSAKKKGKKVTKAYHQVKSVSNDNADASVSQTWLDDQKSLECQPAFDDDDFEESTEPSTPRVSIAKSLRINFVRKMRSNPKRSAIVTAAILGLAVLLVTVAVVFLQRRSNSASMSSIASMVYVPGKLVVSENHLVLSQGLSSKIIATAGMPVQYPSTGSASLNMFQSESNLGETLHTSNGGWIYVSNADEQGNIGALTFDNDGTAIKYKILYTGTNNSRGCGKTPWDAWISCEDSTNGRCYQVDPTGQRDTSMITVGEETDGGHFNSFAYWALLTSGPHFFVSADGEYDSLQRFIPDQVDWSNPWNMLLGPGTTMYLLLNPHDRTFDWTFDADEAQVNAEEYFPGPTSVDQYENCLYFVSKSLKRMCVLNLLEGTYSEQSTDGQYDQLVRIKEENASDIFYYSQNADNAFQITARNAQGPYSIVGASEGGDEATGLAFSPNGKHMYFVLNKAGIVYDITRNDGLGFQIQPPHIEYGSAGSNRLLI
ncbi:hypothetical protein MPSEU_000069900 [Mayamaea pseudoterrestris]|nr:hypothetical protein MPSEU_000069900 [Mayamaea pseudoterrestris]